MLRLTEEEARRIILGRQGLLDPYATPLEAVDAMLAVQTQYAASLPVAVAARTSANEADWHLKALAPDGPIVKSWSVRRTLHAHTRENHALLIGALGVRFYSSWRSWLGRQGGFDSRQCDALEAQVLKAVRDRPITRKELHELIPELRSMPYAGWGLDVMGLAFKGRLCVVGTGTEQRFAHCEISQPATLSDVLRRYLASYGPATPDDFAYWVGLCKGDVNHAFDSLEPCEIEGRRGPRYLAIDPAPTDAKLGVRLLAKFDVLMMGHRDKSLFLPDKWRTAVFRKAGQVEATVLSEGVVCATWRMQRSAKRTQLKIEALRRLSKREVSRLEQEAFRMCQSLKVPEPELLWAN